MAKDLKIGFVGTGEIAATHASILKEIGCQITHASSRGQARLERFCQRFGAQAAASPEQVFKEVDAAFVTTPGGSHADLASLAIENDCHLYIEKPCTFSLAQADSLAQAAREKGIVLQPGFNRRFAPVYRRLGQFFDDHTVKMYNGRLDRGDMKSPSWVADSKLSGGLIRETLIHFLDLAQYFAGPVIDAQAFISSSHGHQHNHISVLLRHENGVHGTLTSSGGTTWQLETESFTANAVGAACTTTGFETAAQADQEKRAERSFEKLPAADRRGFQAAVSAFVKRIDAGLTEEAVRARGEVGYPAIAAMRDSIQLVEVIEKAAGVVL